MRCSRVSPLNPGGCCVLSRKWGFKLKGSSAMASKEEGYLKGRERRDARARLHGGGLHDGHVICRLNGSASNVAAGAGPHVLQASRKSECA